MNYANVWMAPARGFAILVCANQGGGKAREATDDAVAVLVKVADSLTALHKRKSNP